LRCSTFPAKSTRQVHSALWDLAVRPVQLFRLIREILSRRSNLLDLADLLALLLLLPLLHP